jgi:hypothetical protein
MRGNAHVRFGGRPGETDRRQRRHRAPGRPNLERVNKEIKRRTDVVGVFHRPACYGAWMLTRAWRPPSSEVPRESLPPWR